MINQKIILRIFLSIILIIGNDAMAKSVCNILMSNTNIPPYAENVAGDILATFNAAVLGQLIKTDDSFNLKPGLLELFEFDYNKSAYILRLKNGLKFHNGRDVTSKDLEFSLLRGFFSTNSSFYKVYLVNILGIDKVNPEDNFTTGKVEGVKVIDNLTIEVRLSTPNPSFLHVLTNPYFSLVPIEELKSDYINWNNVPVGAGPYRIIGSYGNGHLKLDLVDKRSNAPSQVNFYTLAVDNVRFDIVSDLATNFNSLEFTEINTEKPLAMRTIYFSNSNPLGSNKYFKKAVHQLLDRDTIAEGSNVLFPAYQMLPRHFWGRASEGFKPNIKKAREHISKIPKELIEKKWQVPFFGGSQLNTHQQFIADKLTVQFRKIGLDIEFITTKDKFPSRESVKEYPMRISGMVTDYLDPLIMFSAFRSDSASESIQPTGSDSEKFDKLYKLAANATSFEDRIKTIKNLSEFVQEEAVAVAIGEEKGVYYINPNTITSLGDQPQPLVLFIENVRMK